MKERVRVAQDALKELSAVAGVEYKLDLPDIESEVKEMVRGLYEKKESFEREVPEITEEIEGVRRECREVICSTDRKFACSGPLITGPL